jgi:hypothetical protein
MAPTVCSVARLAVTKPTLVVDGRVLASVSFSSQNDRLAEPRYVWIFRLTIPEESQVMKNADMKDLE